MIKLVALLLILAGCTQQTAPTPVATPTPEPVKLEPLPWKQASWDIVLMSELRKNLDTFRMAGSDMKRFCPKFMELSPDMQVQALSHMAVAMAKRESNWKPTTVYREPPPLNQDSIGLFQMSYGNRGCPKSKAEGDLMDPLVNIRCAVFNMARLVGEDKVIAAGGKYVTPKGLARYWSVIRIPDKLSKHYLDEIIAQTKKAPGCM